MFNNGKIFMVRCLTPTHAGVGQDIGSVDMPIQREGNTNLPKIEASTFKGSLRSALSNTNSNEVEEMFGKGNDDGGEGKAGCIGITDLKLLFYPVKSRDNFYKLITCPNLLNRFVEDSNLLGIEAYNDSYINNAILSGECYTSNTKTGTISIDEYEYKIINEKGKIGNIDSILKLIINERNIENLKEIVVISNNDFIELEELNREIITRNRIDEETGIVKRGALFTEEYLPTESIMYGLFLLSPLTQNTSENYINELKRINYFQIGGNSNLGKGIIEMKIVENRTEGEK